MKQINRFKVLIALLAVIITYCGLYGFNKYVNTLLILFGVCVVILGFAYIEGHMTEKEERFFNNLINKF